MEEAGAATGAAPLQEWGTQLRAGLQALEEQRYPTAAAVFTALLSSTLVAGPSRAQTLYWWGTCFSLDHQPIPSLADLTAALELAPTEAALYTGRSRVYLGLDRLTEAQADIARALELAPDDGAANLLQGTIDLKLRHYAEVLPHLIEVWS